MELRFKGQFKRDIDKIENREVLKELRDTILRIKKASDLSQIKNLVKLKNYRTHYRIRIHTDYRIGIVIRRNVIWFARFGHRSIFYKKFP